MVRFKVIHGSRLLFGAAVTVLILVLCALLIKLLLDKPAQPAVGMQSNFVQGGDAAEGADISTFSATSGALGAAAMPLFPLPESDEAARLLIEVVPPEPDAAPTGAPRILIYHTHTHEAYRQEEEDPYAAVEAWRTTDNSHNVVRVGDELTRLLQAKGFEVVHDTTDHEQDSLSTAYTRSWETLQKYDEPFDLYIDLHRDAYVENSGPVTLSASGREYARLMVLIGRGDDFSVKPYYEENYAFAVALTDALNQLQSGICKDVLVKKNRYNQHVGTPALLIEVGNNQNTLSEALASMPILADAIGETLDDYSGHPAALLAVESK